MGFGAAKMANKTPSWKRLYSKIGMSSLSVSNTTAEKRRQIMESDWYKALFPGTRVSESRLLESKTTNGGSCQAVSVGGPVTGRGADLIILDDCMKAEDVTSEAERGNIKNWFSNALSTRLNDKRDGAIVSIQQQLHEDDLPAFLADKGYTCLNLPAVAEEDQLFAIGGAQTYLRKAGELLDPVRFPQEVLDQELTADPKLSVRTLAQPEGLDPGYVGRMLKLAFLNPKLVQKFVDGTAPAHIIQRKLLRDGIIVPRWSQQRVAIESTAVV